MKLILIGEGCYKILPHLAKVLSVDGKLPRAGYVKQVNSSKLRLVHLGHLDYSIDVYGKWVPFYWKAKEAKQAWIVHVNNVLALKLSFMSP